MTSSAARIFERRPDLLPSLAVALGGVMWGLFWIPARAVGDAGIGAAWIGALMLLCMIVLFLPFAVWRWREFLKGGLNLWIACSLVGLAFTLYAASLNLTEVVRALLLFYVSPVWSTLLGIFFLGERLTVNRIAAVALGIGGLVVVLGDGGGFPWPRGIGDWFAVASGIAWSVGTTRFFQGGATLLFEKTYCLALCALVWAVIIALLPFDMEAALPTSQAVLSVWPWLAVIALLFLPAFYFVVWPASVLSPGRVTILFLFEAIVGIVSAAIFLDEPFGSRELIGTVMIVGAGIVEVIRPQRLSKSNVEVSPIPAEE